MLVDLVSRTNVYIARQGRKDVNLGVLRNIGGWLTRMLKMFGLAEGSAAGTGSIGWGRASAAGEEEGSVDVSWSSILAFIVA